MLNSSILESLVLPFLEKKTTNFNLFEKNIGESV